MSIGTPAVGTLAAALFQSVPRAARFTLLITWLIAAAFVCDAFGQLARVGSPRLVDSGDTMIGGDAAYDPVNSAYLVVMAREGADTDGSVRGAFVDTSGNPLAPPFLIRDAGRANFARAVYSPHVSNGAGGLGAFLVTWTEPFVPGIYSQIVAYPNSVVGPVHLLGPEYSLREIAYSPTAQTFLVAWESHDPPSAMFSIVGTDAQQDAGPILLANGNAGRPWVIWNSITSTAWHSSRNEFGVLYAAQSAGTWTMRFARVNGAGAILDNRHLINMGAEPLAAAMAFSPLTGNYVALWAEPTAGAITGLELTGAGGIVSIGPIPQTIVGGQNGMALSYSAASGSFLLLGFSVVGTLIEQVKGIELNKHGAPGSSVIEVTDFPLTTNYAAPRAAGRSDAPEWLVTAGTTSTYVQVVSTSTLHGGSDVRLGGCHTPDPFAAMGGGVCYTSGWLPPGMSIPGTTPPAPAPAPSPAPTGCATPDPFVALGGGTCYNGNWLPPGMPIPGGGSSTPPPSEPPPSPPPTGCATPDPFVALGGGTCYNGNWLPPGMPIPGGGSSTPPPPAPSPSPTPTGCTTPDPFVALGGGTCYNGNWLPPGMPIPGGGSSTPPPPAPSPSPTPTGCTTPDPFVALGGGTCHNGNWLPPGMPVPGTDASPAPPPPPTDGCSTPDPFVALGGGQCVDGDWLPPGMYLPGKGIIGPNPDPLVPPPPQSTNDCAMPDPYLGTENAIGVCVNGTWQAVSGAHANGTVFLFDGFWLLREDDTGLLYTPLNGMPSSFHVQELPVYFEGMLRLDILHTFPAPILQVRVLATQ